MSGALEDYMRAGQAIFEKYESLIEKITEHASSHQSGSVACVEILKTIREFREGK